MKKNSFTILEVILAIFILTVGVFGSFSLIQQTLIAASLNQSKLVAYYFVQEGLETIRNIRDGNWLEKRTNPSVSWDAGLTGSCPAPRISPCDFYGDINIDGVVSNEDGSGCAGCVGSTEEFCLERCDVDGNGNINTADLTKIDRYVACLDNTFSVCGTSAKFKREITITPESSDKLRVSARVTWKERERNYNVEVVDYFYNWR